MYSAARYNGDIAVFPYKEVVVYRFRESCLADDNRYMYAFFFCSVRNMYIYSGFILFCNNLYVLG